MTKQKISSMDGQPTGMKKLKPKKLYLQIMMVDGTSLDHLSPL